MFSKYLFHIWLFLIVLVNIIPTNTTPVLEQGTPRIMNICFDHLLHFVGFFLLPLLYYISLRYGKLRHKTCHYLTILIISLVMAVLVELVQKALPYRSFSIKDIFYNLTGVIIGFSVFHYIIKRALLKQTKLTESE